MNSRIAVFVLLMPLLVGCLSFHSGPMPGEPKGATFADVDGVRVRYTDTGGEDGRSAATSQPGQHQTNAPKPTVVLVHGFASSLETWTAVAPALEATYRVIALDLKGFGWTDRPEGDYSPEAQARLVLRLLDLRGVERAAFVGHSWGSSVVLAATLAAPERVTKLALYDAWVYEEQLPTFFHWARAGGLGETLFGLFYSERADERIGAAFYDKSFVTEKLVEDVEAALERPGTVAAALAAVRGQRYAAVQSRYRTIRQKTLLLWGKEDAVTTPVYGERLARDLPNARLVVYPRCGHFPMIEAISASNADLVSFLAEDSGKAP